MALVPESSETFAREVDENLRRDQLRDAAQAYGKWAIAAVVLLVLLAGALLLWRDHREKVAGKDTEALSAAIDNIGRGNVNAVPGQLEPLEKSHADAVSVSAKLTRAALALQQNDRATALSVYKDVSADTGVAAPWRDLATIRLTALEFDSLQPQAVIDRLQPLAIPGNPWFGSAGEMTALAMLKAGRKSEAGRLFATVARDASVPLSIRARTAQIAGTLGVDAGPVPLPPAQ